MPVTAVDYSRAERFLSWNQDAYVRNAELRCRWVDSDRFWYRRTKSDGETQFVLMDAKTGGKSPAFDHKKVAALLQRETGERVAAGALPFSEFTYIDDSPTIQFELGGRLWTCNTKEETCVSRPGTAAAAESVSPDGKWRALVRDHNIWIGSTAGSDESPLTTDGEQHRSYAGSPGYSTHAVTDVRSKKAPAPMVIWSPDSRFLLTHRIDERLVKELHLMQSVPEDGSVRPRIYPYRYALPGDEHLPLLEPVALDVIGRRVVNLSAEPLVCSVQSLVEKRDTWWSSDSKAVYYLKRGRFSTEVSLHRADLLAGTTQELIRESGNTVVQTNARNIFVAPCVRTLSNGDVIWYSQRSGWGHLYYYTAEGGLRNQITSGEWAVRELLFVDEQSGKIFFAASGREGQRDPYEQLIYRAQFDGSGLELLTEEEGDHEWPDLSCGGRFAPSGKYFLDSYSRPDVPPVHVVRSVDGKIARKLEAADLSRLREAGYTPIEPFRVLAADGRTKIYGNLYRPSTFDPAKRYPVIDAIYPGPQIIRTAKSFVGATFGKFILDAQALAELGFIVITIDGRGTPYRSRQFLDYSYGRLDKASELDDHIAGLRQLSRRYPYMDLDRVGIDGASGGGFAAARALMAHPEFYKVAVAAAGNHDQRGNLAPWAETYIGPFDEATYAASSTLPLVEGLGGKLLLMHGELDDNVHPALTMKLVDALIRANKDFELLIIPNADHSAYATSEYFIRRKWDFFVRHLLGEEPPRGYRVRAGTGSNAACNTTTQSSITLDSKAEVE